MPPAKICDVCGVNSFQAVLVNTDTNGEGKSYCMRCFHALLHGLSPEQLKERWKSFAAQKD